MENPRSAISVRYQRYSAPVPLLPSQGCSWLRSRRSPAASTACMDALPGEIRGPVTTTMDVSPGTLSAQ